MEALRQIQTLTLPPRAQHTTIIHQALMITSMLITQLHHIPQATVIASLLIITMTMEAATITIMTTMEVEVTMVVVAIIPAVVVAAVEAAVAAVVAAVAVVVAVAAVEVDAIESIHLFTQTLFIT